MQTTVINRIERIEQILESNKVFIPSYVLFYFLLFYIYFIKYFI